MAVSPNVFDLIEPPKTSQKGRQLVFPDGFEMTFPPGTTDDDIHMFEARRQFAQDSGKMNGVEAMAGLLQRISQFTQQVTPFEAESTMPDIDASDVMGLTPEQTSGLLQMQQRSNESMIQQRQQHRTSMIGVQEAEKDRALSIKAQEARFKNQVALERLRDKMQDENERQAEQRAKRQEKRAQQRGKIVGSGTTGLYDIRRDEAGKAQLDTLIEPTLTGQGGLTAGLYDDVRWVPGQGYFGHRPGAPDYEPIVTPEEGAGPQELPKVHKDPYGFYTQTPEGMQRIPIRGQFTVSQQKAIIEAAVAEKREAWMEEEREKLRFWQDDSDIPTPPEEDFRKEAMGDLSEHGLVIDPLLWYPAAEQAQGQPQAPAGPQYIPGHVYEDESTGQRMRYTEDGRWEQP